MTDMEKMYLLRAFNQRQADLRKAIGDTRRYNVLGDLIGEFIPTGSRMEKNCLEEIEALYGLAIRLTGFGSCSELGGSLSGLSVFGAR